MKVRSSYMMSLLVACLPRLERIICSANIDYFAPAEYRALCTLTRLVTLKMTLPALASDGLQRLAELRQCRTLQKLRVCCTLDQQHGEHALGAVLQPAAGLAWAAGLTALTNLCFEHHCNIPLCQGALAHLSGLMRLRKLALIGCGDVKLRDSAATFQHLAPLVHLERLEVEGIKDMYAPGAAGWVGV